MTVSVQRLGVGSVFEAANDVVRLLYRPNTFYLLQLAKKKDNLFVMCTLLQVHLEFEMFLLFLIQQLCPVYHLICDGSGFCFRLLQKRVLPSWKDEAYFGERRPLRKSDLIPVADE